MFSPARAGMDPRVAPFASLFILLQPGCFPRTRGDGPHSLALRVSPRAQCSRRSRRDVSPARAGMDLALAMRYGRDCAMTSFPRTRGDGPRFATGRDVPAFLSPPFPPHARGWTPLLGNLTSHSTVDLECFPRTRGDGPCRYAVRRLNNPPGCFPRTRGDGPTSEHAGIHRRLKSRNVSPARAGMDLAPLRTKRPATLLRGFPRTRGEPRFV